MKKKVNLTIFFWMVFEAMFYLCVAFINADMDFTHWSDEGRTGLGVLMIISSITFLIVIITQITGSDWYKGWGEQ